MSYNLHLPQILLSIPRNPVTALGLPLALGILSGSSTKSVVQGQWYKNLRVPPGRPPRQVFPIVWPLLYLSMGYASHLAVKALDNTLSPNARSSLNLGLALYYGQLAFNFIWSPLFFNVKQVGLALVDIALLAGTTFYMTKLLHAPTNSKTSVFLVPYCAWLTFATYLNGGIWWLNRGRLDLSKED
ncbi:TspO/MBR-related protein [Marasmius fiardii PR-910]|nr:TspO/MBR-related protein [Marasmius fiardii PR-910]